MKIENDRKKDEKIEREQESNSRPNRKTERYLPQWHEGLFNLFF